MTDPNVPASPEPTPAAEAAPAAQPAPAAYSAPAAPAQPVAATADTFPGKGLGIAGLIVAIFLPLIGLILSIVARSQSKSAGFKNTPATVGIIIGIVLIVLGIIAGIIFAVAGAALFGAVVDYCSQLGPGTWDVDGVIYTCG